VLEFGDRVKIHEWRFTKLANRSPRWDKWVTSKGFSWEWKRRDLRWMNSARKRAASLSDIGVETRTRLASYRPRPFMGPTLERSQATVRRILASAFQGA
jgi:hypothetical protein